MQTDNIKTKLCKDQLIDNQADLINPVDKETETDVDLTSMKMKDGVGELVWGNFREEKYEKLINFKLKRVFGSFNLKIGVLSHIGVVLT